MRLDLFLKASRLCQRRTTAQQLCAASLVLVNGNPAKSAHAVKPGDEITLCRGDRLTKVKVLLMPTRYQISRKEGSELFEILIDERSERDHS